MTRDWDVPDRQRSAIRAALRAFSPGQLSQMRAAGVRFWSDQGLPPSLAGSFQPPDMTTRAQYVPQLRVIQLRPRAGADDIRHELAHAWDHVRAGRVRPLDGLSERQLERELNRPIRMGSESSRRHRVGSGGSAQRLTIRQMLALYIPRLPERALGFDNPATREGYSRRSPREFYAEGYSVFHGPHVSAQARLLHFAPELYELLEREARDQNLPTPDRSRLQQEIREQHLR
jgi:hypothetical protein